MSGVAYPPRFPPLGDLPQPPVIVPAPSAPSDPADPYAPEPYEPEQWSITPGTAVQWAATKDTSIVEETLETDIGPIIVDLAALTSDPVVPGSVQFKLGTKRYIDRNGMLYTDIDPRTGSGTPAGTVNYASKRALVTAPPSGVVTSVTMESLLTAYSTLPVADIFARVTAAPLKPGVTQVIATTIDGRTLTASDDGTGSLTGSAEINGYIEVLTGIYRLRFGRKVVAAELTPEEQALPWYDPDLIDEEGKIWRPTLVLPSTVRITTVGYTYLPLSADILKLDPVRLPVDGRVPIFRKGDVVVVHHTDALEVANPVAGGTWDVGRERISRYRIVDATETPVPSNRYSYDTDDLNAGTGTWADPLDLEDYTLPLTIYHTVEDGAVVTDVQIDGTISLNRALSHVYPADDALISGAVMSAQSLGAKTSVPFAQETWTGVFSDTLIGDPPEWQYNHVVYPVEMANRHAIKERWALVHTNPTTVNVIGERVGIVAAGVSINTDIAPINPQTGGPYFTLRAAGWSGTGLGVLRFNTLPAAYPVAIVRARQPGPASEDPQRFLLVIRADIDA